MQRPTHTRSRILGAVCLAVAATAAHAQLETFNQPPVIGGKDVMWVPTPDAAVDRMLSLANVGPRDLVYDLGSGDGKIAIIAIINPPESAILAVGSVVRTPKVVDDEDRVEVRPMM